MADNIAVTPGAGAIVAADEVAGALHQRVKISLGADGVYDGDVSSSNPLPISDAGGSVTVDGTVSVSGTVAVSAATLPLPSGAATAANQSTIIGHVDNIEALLGTIDADTSVLAGVVSGSEMQVDVVSSALPTGAATEATLSALASEDFATETTLASIDSALAGTLSVNVGLTDVELRASPVAISGTITAEDSGFVDTQFIRNDYSSVNVTTTAYVELIASTPNDYQEIEIFDSSGQTLKLAFGAASSEVDKILIFPGGNGRVKLNVPASTRISIRAVSATASVGEVCINFYG